MNEILLILTLIFSLVSVIICYKYFGKNGLFLWIIVATLTSNIQTAKTIKIFGLDTSLGTILHGSTCLATDIINYKYGLKESKKTIIYSFLSMIIMTLFMALALVYVPSPNDFAHESLTVIFTFNMRITIASLLGFVISQIVDIKLFSHLQSKYKKLWLSTNVSTTISQIIDTIIFTFVSFLGIIEITAIFEIMITMYILKFFLAIFDVPFIYIADKIKKVREY